MASSFPLYDMLNKNASDKDFTVKEENEFLKNTSMLNEEGHEAVYSLIKHHAIISNSCSQENPSNPPFAGERIDTTFKFCLEDIPPRLKRILLNFTRMHMEVMARGE